MLELKVSYLGDEKIHIEPEGLCPADVDNIIDAKPFVVVAIVPGEESRAARATSDWYDEVMFDQIYKSNDRSFLEAASVAATYKKLSMRFAREYMTGYAAGVLDASGKSEITAHIYAVAIESTRDLKGRVPDFKVTMIRHIVQ